MPLHGVEGCAARVVGRTGALRNFYFFAMGTLPTGINRLTLRAVKPVLTWLLWGLLSAGALFGLAGEGPAPVDEAQTWLTQSRPDVSVASPAEVTGLLVRAPEPARQPHDLRKVSVRASRLLPNPRRSVVCRAGAKARRGRPWARHGTHIPRMNDEPPPGRAPR